VFYARFELFVGTIFFVNGTFQFYKAYPNLPIYLSNEDAIGTLSFIPLDFLIVQRKYLEVFVAEDFNSLTCPRVYYCP